MSSCRQPVVLITESGSADLRTALGSEEWEITFLDSIAASDRESVDAILHISGRPISQDFLGQFENLQAICTVGDARRTIDRNYVAERGVSIYSVKENTEDAAEHALILLYATWLQLTEDQWVERDADWVEAHSLRGRKVGVVGLGAIGAAFAKRASTCGMDVSWWGPHRKSSPWPRADSLAALAERNDILVVMCRDDATTRGLISKGVLQAVGSSGALVSLVGGEVVDEAALVAALRSGQLGSAVLDVSDHDEHAVDLLRSVPNLTLTSRAASVTLEFMVESTALAIRHLQKHFSIAGHIPDHSSPTSLQLDALKHAFLARVEATDRALATRRH